jgi:OFA family oxalate/formate antiporter-like MFS transporter
MTKTELLDELMKKDMHCPFYGKEAAVCDVGRGYISVSVAQSIANYCSCKYTECSRYQTLVDLQAMPQRTQDADCNLGIPHMTGGNMPQAAQNRGWIVTLAGTAINLALGILYTWSIFKGAIKASIEKGGPGSFRWDLASINDPYAVCCLVFAFAMIVAGKCQDKVGPRVTALAGGLLVGAGFFWISQTTSYGAWVLGFGVLAGTGIGFGYSSATPPALKWFPPARTGLIAGLVVSGFGLASVYIAPLATWLLKTYGLQQAMLFFGIGFLFVVSGLSMLLTNPPKGYVAGAAASKADAPVRKAARDYSPSEILKTPTFYLLWLLFFIGSGAGLMVIGSVAGMAKKSLGELAFLAVAIMAVGNAGGRIVAGLLSDKIGRARTLFVMMASQALMMFAAIPIVGSKTTSPIVLVLLATFIGFNYGTNLALFPSFAKDLWGLKNFGTNYGVLFSAWGVGGFVMGRVSEMLQARSAGSFDSCFIAAGLCLILAAALALKIKTREQLDAESAALVPAPAVQKA